jgi:uncharacterized protein (DUF2249 family)
MRPFPLSSRRAGSSGTPEAQDVSSAKFKVLDVRRHLASGEEPFPLIRARVDSLKAGQGLTVVAPFMPAPLIELLKSEGFQSTMERRLDGAWAVNFWREDGP